MTNTDTNKTALVTGGTGFVGIHCILQLLQQGYTVKTTIRSIHKKEKVLMMLQNGGITSFDKLSFIEADLSADKNWDEAVENCRYVLHVASPIFLKVPNDENEFIQPAVEGTLRVLRAAKDAGVQRVVLTSSFAAVGYSHKDPHTLITEDDWTDPDEKGLSAYVKSKAMAEKAAWDFIKTEGGQLELSVINPMAIFGPSLGPDLSSGFEILKKMLDGSMKALPQIGFGIVDVRDVAALHLKAMTSPVANGQRFLAFAGGVLSLREVALLLKNKLGEKAQKVSTRSLPNWLLRLAAIFSPAARNIAGQLGKIKTASNAKAKSLLGWAPRTNEEAILASAESLLKYNLAPSTN